MLSSIAGWVEDKATGYLRTGIQAGGTLAGNAVGGVGSLVESAGKTAGSTVSGGIGGVGNTINGYGEGIKRSMSADGPVSNSPKKTAVKPSTGPKAVGSAAGTVKKPVPSSQALQQKSATAPKTSTPKVGPAATKKQPSGPVAARPPQGAAGAPRAPASTATKTQSKTAPDGKIRVSPESRPGYKKPSPGARTATPAARKHEAGDPLGIGKNFGDISKTQGSKPTSTKPQGGAARKPSAGDPLALGDLANIGKKK